MSLMATPFFPLIQLHAFTPGSHTLSWHCTWRRLADSVWSLPATTCFAAAYFHTSKAYICAAVYQETRLHGRHHRTFVQCWWGRGGTCPFRCDETNLDLSLRCPVPPVFPCMSHSALCRFNYMFHSTLFHSVQPLLTPSPCHPVILIAVCIIWMCHSAAALLS